MLSTYVGFNSGLILTDDEKSFINPIKKAKPDAFRKTVESVIARRLYVMLRVALYHHKGRFTPAGVEKVPDYKAILPTTAPAGTPDQYTQLIREELKKWKKKAKSQKKSKLLLVTVTDELQFLAAIRGKNEAGGFISAARIALRFLRAIQRTFF